MDMKKVTCVVIVAAASMSAALAAIEAPEASPAAAPGPSSGAVAASFPVVGSLIGASVKINIDGASRGNPGLAACGVVIRNDDEGRWIAGPSRSLGIASAVRAETWGVMDSLNLAWGISYRKIELECHSLVLV
ncbi:hypothetical protein L6164_012112 [Bauhinia variegata]|uniref:Uncharacterized protein n=1 Tax=Bauhinia variegata TaxID=167791 RepID=A0ACB9P852_BAUVA|nr:hypothetical protein L6164_012112 [Bauhinia variegata]